MDHARCAGAIAITISQVAFARHRRTSSRFGCGLAVHGNDYNALPLARLALFIYLVVRLVNAMERMAKAMERIAERDERPDLSRLIVNIGNFFGSQVSIMISAYLPLPSQLVSCGEFFLPAGIWLGGDELFGM